MTRVGLYKSAAAQTWSVLGVKGETHLSDDIGSENTDSAGKRLVSDGALASFFDSPVQCSTHLTAFWSISVNVDIFGMYEYGG